MTVQLLPGDVGLGRNNTLGGWAIRIGDGIWAKRHHVEAEPYNHAVLYLGDGRIVQAEPNGAQIATVDPSRFDWYRANVTGLERQEIAHEGRALAGTPYNWLDIAALTLRCLGWDVIDRDGKLTRIGRRLNRNDRLVCSALVDLAYQRAGIPPLFDDGRISGAVTPADLARCPKLKRVC